tara:strand:- start:251 stop:640 length:390 start_codon:yes stop_codon:yes gene_type:complete
MDDFGNILYFIFIAISLAGGLWQNYKKRKQKQKEQQEETYSAPSYEFESEEVHEISDAIQESDAKAREQIEMHEQKALEAWKNRRIKRRSDILIESESEQVDETSKSDIRDFDARKAIIYSEIINPPYL